MELTAMLFLQLTSIFLCQVLLAIIGPLSEKKTMSKNFEITSKMFLITLRNQKMLDENPTVSKEQEPLPILIL